MKKQLFTLGLVSALTMTALAGCGAQTTQPETNETETPKEVLRVGMDLKFPPFSDMDASGNPIGLEPTIAYAFGDYMDMNVEIVNLDFSMLLSALELGQLDILIADMTRTDARAEKADFSDMYRYTHRLALVNRTYAEEMGITDSMPEDEFFALEGNEFVGLAGTMGVLTPQSFGVDVTEVTEIGSAIMEVKNGTATSLVASNEIQAFHAANKEDTIVYSGITEFSGSSFVVGKGDSELLTHANTFIATMYEDGGLYEGLHDEFDPIIADFLQNDDLGLDYIVYPPNSH